MDEKRGPFDFFEEMMRFIESLGAMPFMLGGRVPMRKPIREPGRFVDVVDAGDHYVLTTELAGVGAERIRVSAGKNSVEIKVAGAPASGAR